MSSNLATPTRIVKHAGDMLNSAKEVSSLFVLHCPDLDQAEQEVCAEVVVASNDWSKGLPTEAGGTLFSGLQAWAELRIRPA